MVGAPVSAEFSCAEYWLDGPGATISTPPDNIPPGTVADGPCTEQSVVAFTAMVTSALESGVTVISHRAFLPASSRRTLLIKPPVTVKAWLRTVV